MRRRRHARCSTTRRARCRHWRWRVVCRAQASALHQGAGATTCRGVGIATQGVNDDGIPAILRESTTYQKNLYGQGDDAYELVPTLATLSALFRSQRYAITSKYPRHKLADDGTRFGAGQAIVTPKIIKAELIAQYRADEFLGRVENARHSRRNLIVERDPNDPNRVNVLYPPDLINQLRIFAVLAQFRLQYTIVALTPSIAAVTREGGTDVTARSASHFGTTSRSR